MLKFTRLRRAKNGFIFKTRKNMVTGEVPTTDNEDDYEYELVHEEELNQKFGEVFNPASISQDDGEVVVCTYWCNAKIFDKKEKDVPESIMKAKQMFAMFKHEMFPPKDVVIIEYMEKQNPYLEFYEDDAERVNRQTNVPVMMKDNVRYIWLAANQENKRLLGTLSPHVVQTTLAEVRTWYEGTKIVQ